MTGFRPRIHQVFVQVSDVERSRRFYEDLGFVFHRMDPADNSHYARIGAAELILHPDFGDELKSKERGAGCNTVFWVDDADAYYKEITDKGIATDQEPEDRPWGREFHMRDPDGYVLEFIGPAGHR